MNKVKYIIILLFLILNSCVKQTTWPVPDQLVNLIVVDAIITDVPGRQAIHLSYPVTNLNESPRPVTNAIVLISNEDSSWTLTEPDSIPGTYLTNPTFYTGLDKNYSLHISVGDKIYTAKTFMVPGKSFGPLHYIQNTDNNLYHIDYVSSAFSSSDPAMWEIIIDWSHVPGWEQNDPQKSIARLLFYTLPTLDISEVFAPVMEQVSFPAGSIITERRYSLNPDHAAYIRELLLETNWQGGLFPSAPANVKTNLSNGATGFFGACAVTSLSLTVTP